MRHYLATLFVVIVFAFPWLAVHHPEALNNFSDLFGSSIDQLAAVVIHKPKTVAGLQSKYNASNNFGTPKVRILVVPGHEPEYGGAEYKDVKERELVVPLAENLIRFLKESGKYEVFTTRTALKWDANFDDYFNNHKEEIISWKQAHKTDFSRLLSLSSSVPTTPNVIHNDVPANVANRLYGITKWSNENDVDIAIHVHLNDYPGHTYGTTGEYTGFAIYVPSGQYYNSTTTRAVADSVFRRLSKYNPASDMPSEVGGIIDDPELIAVGAHNTSDAPSMLIEYGYLYEQQFIDSRVRDMALKDLAYQTFLGLEDFFDPTNAIKLGRHYDTLVLPHNWSSAITADTSKSLEVYALQTALRIDGSYPPSGKSLNECPRTGKLGPCTKSAIELFQKKYLIKDEKNVVGPKTIKVLNENYGEKVI